MGTEQVLPLRISLDLGVMTMKGYSTFPKAPGLEPHHQMDHNHIQASNLSSKKQSAHSTTPADWAENIKKANYYVNKCEDFLKMF